MGGAQGDNLKLYKRQRQPYTKCQSGPHSHYFFQVNTVNSPVLSPYQLITCTKLQNGTDKNNNLSFRYSV